MPRRAQTGAYLPVKTALCLPFELTEHEACDIARGVEILTERVVDLHPCRPSAAYPFAHYALWIYGNLTPRMMRSVERLLNEYKLRAPS